MADRLQALKAGDWLDFWGCDGPKCPHCGAQHNPSDYGGDRPFLYAEGDHDMTCDHCEQDFRVSVRVSFSYSTDKQGE